MKVPAVVAALVASASALAPLYAESPKLIPSQYIVKVLSSASVEQHLNKLQAQLQQNEVNQIVHKYNVNNGEFQGYSIRCNEETLGFIRRMEDVAFVEQDSYVTISATQTNPPSWGQDRVDQRNLPLNSRLIYSNNAGTGVRVYTIDTGIMTTHNDFGGRVSWGVTIPDNASDSDANGHGTHCTGTILGTSYGLAKKATGFAVKVLGDMGFGSTADVIAGVDWVSDRHDSHGGNTVANMSLGGGASTALDNAVTSAVNNGVHVIVAAGNDNANACNYSPARAAAAITVGATDSSDRRSSFSNYGTCVDIFGPGTSITSTWIGTNTATRTISGTSMAAPHVAGVVALYLGDKTETPSQIATHLTASSTKNVLTDIPASTVNYLVYNDAPAAI